VQAFRFFSADFQTAIKVTREVKELLAEVVRKPVVQKALEEGLVKGDSAAFFKAVEMVHGKSRQTVDQELTGPIETRWKGEGDD
jgi:hypothetical protein